ncbi:hypothetical protein [Gordoniibacillus kamchatkensis]|uniref:hypothetical protein n=1 Tax=Gordoniibacillus kamchatkensis TaxID=1590651 RepID=UPI000A64B365|nr:hypothetical protein [Paenibacillus sp. VKM B-2647]
MTRMTESERGINSHQFNSLELKVFALISAECIIMETIFKIIEGAKMVEENDYFDLNFDMSKYPSFFRSEKGMKERQILSKFFGVFHKFYNDYASTQRYHPVNFILNRPHHMIFGTYNDTLYFVLSSSFAIKGRTSVFMINEGTYIDIEKTGFFAAACGFDLDGEAISCDIPRNLIDNPEEDENMQKIKKEAKGLIEFEIENFERKNKLMRIKPFFGEIEYKINPRKVFMLMPFSDTSLNEFYEDHIKTCIEALDMHCLRADDIFNNKSIMQDIWRNINEARIIVADLTHRNPNVFYELGIAHTLGKEVILISQDEGDIPFDIRHIRTIFYVNTTRGAQLFEEKLSATIKGILEEGQISI